MKICILGNSHVGSLKRGWDIIHADHQEHQITFFASRADGMANLRLENQALVPCTPQLLNDILYTSGGMKEVSLLAYDVYFLYGLGFTLPTMDSRLSSEVMMHQCLDNFGCSLIFKIAEQIRSISASPIFIGHRPQAALTGISEPRPNSLDYEAVFSHMSNAVGASNAVLVEQPLMTLAENVWNTKMEYSSGSTVLDVGDEYSNQPHPPTDVLHMNDIFGRLYLQNFLSFLH